MLIVEGPDFAGKSTFVAEVMRQLRASRWARREGWLAPSVFHHTKPGPNFDYRRDYLRAARISHVADRFALTELVYGRVFRGGPNPAFDPHVRRLVARYLNTIGSVQVLMTASERTIEARMKARGGDEFCPDLNAWRRIHDEYEDAMGELSLGARGVPLVARIESTGTDASDRVARTALRREVDVVLDVWRRYLDRATSIRRLVHGRGSLFPRVLVVGDDDDAEFDKHCPAYQYDDGRGANLSALLDVAGLPERSVYILNRTDWSGIEHALGWLAPRIAVVFQSSTARKLTDAGIRTYHMPHPRTYTARDLQLYGQELTRVLEVVR